MAFSEYGVEYFLRSLRYDQGDVKSDLTRFEESWKSLRARFSCFVDQKLSSVSISVSAPANSYFWTPTLRPKDAKPLECSMMLSTWNDILRTPAENLFMMI